ncbi:hypothetical protein [Vibrio sp. Hal054]|uniref:hypothetical protein n=1 Tax=Vibrio sp. Hal054 TaxID=3035158 RepID=UPI00301B9A32
MKTDENTPYELTPLVEKMSEREYFSHINQCFNESHQIADNFLKTLLPTAQKQQNAVQLESGVCMYRLKDNRVHFSSQGMDIECSFDEVTLSQSKCGTYFLMVGLIGFIELSESEARSLVSSWK